jgi:hypothetical protein
MSRLSILRVLTLGMAFVHSFPACRHIGLFVEAHSLSEGWKGLGALVAIGLYLLPVDVQARALATLWNGYRTPLRIVSMLLIVAHAVPAFEHVPGFVHLPSWSDFWRGFGALAAIAWFACPQPAQVKVIARLGRLARNRRDSSTSKNIIKYPYWEA